MVYYDDVYEIDDDGGKEEVEDDDICIGLDDWWITTDSLMNGGLPHV